MSDDVGSLTFFLSSQGAYTGVPPGMRAAMLRVIDQLVAERARAERYRAALGYIEGWIRGALINQTSFPVDNLLTCCETALADDKADGAGG